MSTRFFLLSILLYTTQFIFAQQGVKGKVINDSNSNPLEFVTVSFDRGNTGGTLTDTDGTFIVDAPKEVKMLSFYLLGFKPLEISLDTIKRKDRDLVVRLIPDEYTLAEVVLRPNENPAYEYVRRVVKNKDKHDPTKSLQSYSYTSYNKFIQDYWRDEEGNLPDSFKVKSILGKIKFLKPSEDKHLFIMESVTEKLCMQRDFSKEKIIATKIAGIKNQYITHASDAFWQISYNREKVGVQDN